uniref:Uncharacterized protein n=1 Tax=Rangifer tarandus platyrhynchus TaxID=3082113 RepID=A0ACB0FHV4_RANTA|nr:unnamed protein product [Rangifer tarandus platyrhynchus]
MQRGLGGPVRRHPSAHPHPLTGPTPLTLLPLRPRAPAVPTVARDPARTSFLASARVPPQPLLRRRRLAIPATVPAILVARSYLPRLSRRAPPPGPHSTPRVSRTGYSSFSSVHVPQDDVTSAALESTQAAKPPLLTRGGWLTPSCAAAMA